MKQAYSVVEQAYFITEQACFVSEQACFVTVHAYGGAHHGAFAGLYIGQNGGEMKELLENP